MNDQLGKLMKQAQKMQADMMEEQEKLNSMVFKGSAGGGMAEVVVNGKMEITDIKIMPEAVEPRRCRDVRRCYSCCYSRGTKES